MCREHGRVGDGTGTYPIVRGAGCHYRECVNEDRRLSPTSQSVARLLDDVVRIPGTRQGIGLDAVIGLIPGVGDLAGAGLSSIILVEAITHRVPIPVLLRMGANLGIDAILGYVPVLGDAADILHRANRKNVRLLEATLAGPEVARDESRGYLLRAGALVALILLLLVASAILMIWLVVIGLRAIGG